MRLPAAVEKVLSVVFAYVPNSSSNYPAFLESLEDILERVPPENFKILLGDFNPHMGDEGESWRGEIGRKSLPNLTSSSVVSLDLCTSHGLSIKTPCLNT